MNITRTEQNAAKEAQMRCLDNAVNETAALLEKTQGDMRKVIEPYCCDQGRQDRQRICRECAAVTPEYKRAMALVWSEYHCDTEASTV